MSSARRLKCVSHRVRFFFFKKKTKDSILCARSVGLRTSPARSPASPFGSGPQQFCNSVAVAETCSGIRHLVDLWAFALRLLPVASRQQRISSQQPFKQGKTPEGRSATFRLQGLGFVFCCSLFLTISCNTSKKLFLGGREEGGEVPLGGLFFSFFGFDFSIFLIHNKHSN